MKSSRRPSIPSVEPYLPVSVDVEKRFSIGQAAGLDPDAAGGSEAPISSRARQVTTTLRSRWLHRLCLVCGHTFRPGDVILLLPGGKVVHDMPGLRCDGLVTEGHMDGSQPRAGTEGGLLPLDTTEANQAFFAGLAAAWPMPDDVPVLRLEGDHPLLAPPRGGIQRRSCRICGHTFRPMDHVVLCPCSVAAKGTRKSCRVAVHRDLLRQLHCWDEWVRGDLRGQCLGFS